MKAKLLDCTIRDGGYYTNWDFEDSLIEDYCNAMEESPVHYVEIGYRSISLNGYLGKYFYCPDYVMKKLKSMMPSKELAIILNEKDVRVNHVHELLNPCIPYISLIRIAIDPKNIIRAIELAKSIKSLGFRVAFNVMYMSNWKEFPEFLESVHDLENIVDYFYMVDSFGGVMPKDVREIIGLVKTKTNVSLGFHGHNNLQMAMANTLTALDEGCTIVDGTITGMGRGAGNLKTELLLTYFESKDQLKLNYTSLSRSVAGFEELKIKYGWGSNLPYMFSGAYSLPQKQVMEWVGMNRYPISSILNALKNQKAEVEDNLRLPILDESSGTFKSAIILGGGKSAKVQFEAIKRFADNGENEICVIHAGVRNVRTYLDISATQFYALSGFESEKLMKEVDDTSSLPSICVFPPFPRKMGTLIPKQLTNISRELKEIGFTKASTDSPLAISVQIALDLKVNEIFLVGFDGYDTSIDPIQFTLAQENQQIINDLNKIKDVEFNTLTPTKYKNVNVKSIFSMIR